MSVEAYGRRAVTHPVAQVRGYCDCLTQFTRALHDRPDAGHGAAYLHNALDPEAVAELHDVPQDE